MREARNHEQAGGPVGVRHDLADWLDVHGLDHETCHQLLGSRTFNVLPKVPEVGEGSQGTQFIFEQAWQQSADALQAVLPDQQDAIAAVSASTDVTFSVRNRTRGRAATIDRGPGAAPAIAFSFCGKSSDWLLVAHEFGHALQISASGGAFMPPVMREVCAFVSERALLNFSAKSGSSKFAELAAVWREDDTRYFGPHKRRLEAALTEPESPYEYKWNYPIARHVASALPLEGSAEYSWKIFEGAIRLPDVLDRLSIDK